MKNFSVFISVNIFTLKARINFILALSVNKFTMPHTHTHRPKEAMQINAKKLGSEDVMKNMFHLYP